MFGTIMRLGKPAIVVLVTSVLWILLCTVYVQVTIGWRDIFTLQPHELGSLFTGIFAPLVFLWLILAYVGRGMVIYETTKNLETELAKLTYSADDSEARVHAIVEALRHQAQEPSAVLERAVSQAQYLHDGLHCQTEQLEAAANDVLSRLEETGAAFGRSLTAMGPNVEAAADRVQAATDASHSDSSFSDLIRGSSSGWSSLSGDPRIKSEDDEGCVRTMTRGRNKIKQDTQTNSIPRKSLMSAHMGTPPYGRIGL